MQDKKEKIAYWLESSKRDSVVAQDLFGKGHYHYALFFWQLVLEKLLKAIIINNTDDYPLPIHDLVKLAKQANLQLNQTQKDQLQEITTFNLQARYDDYKHEFYKKATKIYATKWISISQELHRWLKNQL